MIQNSSRYNQACLTWHAYVCKKYDQMDLKIRIEEVWKNRELLKDQKYTDAIRAVIEETDKGRLRVAEPAGAGWQVNEWVKQAILLYFGIQQMNTWTVGPMEFYDKMD